MAAAPDPHITTMDEQTAFPRHNGTLVFEAPWEARAFGLAVALNEAGVYPWRDFSQGLAAETAALAKAVPVLVTGTMPIKRAISTAGGIAWSEVDDSLMLRAMPGTFVAGEMLDWVLVLDDEAKGFGAPGAKAGR